MKQAAEGGVVAEEYQEHFGEQNYDTEGNYIGPAVELDPEAAAELELAELLLAAVASSGCAGAGAELELELAPAPVSSESGCCFLCSTRQVHVFIGINLYPPGGGGPLA